MNGKFLRTHEINEPQILMNWSAMWKQFEETVRDLRWFLYGSLGFMLIGRFITSEKLQCSMYILGTYCIVWVFTIAWKRIFSDL